jgi:hypothetical protein
MDQPVLRVGDDKEALGERHGAKITKLGRLRRVGLEKFAMRGALKPETQTIVLIFNFSQPKGGLCRVKKGDRVITLDGKWHLLLGQHRPRGRKHKCADQHKEANGILA